MLQKKRKQETREVDSKHCSWEAKSLMREKAVLFLAHSIHIEEEERSADSDHLKPAWCLPGQWAASIWGGYERTAGGKTTHFLSKPIPSQSKSFASPEEERGGRKVDHLRGAEWERGSAADHWQVSGTPAPSAGGSQQLQNLQGLDTWTIKQQLKHRLPRADNQTNHWHFLGWNPGFFCP